MSKTGFCVRNFVILKFRVFASGQLSNRSLVILVIYLLVLKSQPGIISGHKINLNY